MNTFYIVLVTLLLKTSLGANKLSFPKISGQRMSQMLYAKNSDDADEAIKDMLMSFKALMKTGDEHSGIPIMDPLVIDKSFDINNQQLKLKGVFQAEIHNLSNYNIDQIHADMDLNTIVNITLNDVSMNGNYSLNGWSMNLIPITGAGDHHLSFTTLNLALKPQLEVKSGYIRLFNSGFGIQEKDFEFLVEGLLEQADLSKLLAYFLRDLLSSLLSHNLQLAKVLNNNLVTSFNGVDGKGKDIYDIIETVKALAGS